MIGIRIEPTAAEQPAELVIEVLMKKVASVAPGISSGPAAQGFGQRLDEVLVALREFHHEREAHHRNDRFEQLIFLHRVRKRLEQRHRLAGDERQEEAGAEQHQPRFVLLDHQIDGGQNHQPPDCQ